MRIGLFTDTYLPDINGVASSTDILRHELKKHGHEVYVVAPRKGISLAAWDEDHEVLWLNGIELKKLFGYTMTSPFHLHALNEVKKLNLDLIHVQTEFGAGIFAHICAARLSIPLVFTYHTVYEDDTHYINPLGIESIEESAKRLVAWFSKINGDAALKVIAPSEKTRQLLLRYGVKTEIFIAPTGINLDIYNPAFENREKTAQIRKDCGVQENEKLIIYLGRIAPEKSIEPVIEAFALLKKRSVPVRLVIVGKGPSVESLKSLSVSLDTADRVTFAGPKSRSEVPDYYRAADAFVSLSLSETQGMTFAEAMASGLPLFARRDGALKDLLDDGKTGWYVSGSEDLADRIEEFVRLDGSAVQKVKKNALEKVRCMGSEAFYKKVIAVYQSAIDAYRKMPAIIKTEVRSDLVRLYLREDGPMKKTETISVTVDDYVNFGLRKGMKVTPSKLEQLRAAELTVHAYQRCIRKLAAKDRTTFELRKWMKETLNSSDETADAVLKRLKEKGYVDDERYTQEEIARMKSSMHGRSAVIRDLRMKGISQRMINDALTVSYNDEYENAVLFAEKAAQSIKGQSLKMKKSRLRTKIIGKGFEPETADRVIAFFDFSEDAENQLESLAACAEKAKKRYIKKYTGTQLRNAVFRYCINKGYTMEEVYAVLDGMEWSDDKD